MIEVKIKIQDVDYTAAVDVLMPVLLDRLSGSSNPIASLFWEKTKNRLPATAAKAALDVLPNSVKDELFVACLNHYSAEISQTIANLAAQKNIRLKVDTVEVAVSG